ncbi:MAG: serine hydrolase [Balneolaceae bacterium]|nr:serine hydrolase [Balneolaceae bacterium]MCH8549192.1 class A beta-lactamase-related serine hydrolase [Balneolaceae bacterium]
MRILSLLLISLLFLSCNEQAEQAENRDITSLKAEIEEYLSEREGFYAVWFEHLDHPEWQFGINEDSLFHAASTMKTPVMVELFRRAELGDFDLEDSIRVDNLFYSIVDGSEFQLDLDPDAADPFERKEGEMATIWDLNHAMITYSSNIATNLIIQKTGAEETTQTMRDLGAERIEVIRGLYDMKAFDQGLSNRTTARDLGIIFRHIANGTAVSPEMDSLMVEVLKDQYFTDVIPARLPDDVTVANKTGSITGVVHDSGIVYLPDGSSYVLVTLSMDLPESSVGTETNAVVSEMIHRFLTESN